MRRLLHLTVLFVAALGSLTGQVLSKPDPIIIPNAGQWPREVLAMANLDAARVWVLADGLRFAARLPGESDSVAVWTEHYLGAQGGTLDLNPSSHPITYMLGRGSEVTVRGASEAWVRNVYPGVDLELRIESGRLKTWWHGKDLSGIRIGFEGAVPRRTRNAPEVLELETPAGSARMDAAKAFDAQGREVRAQWQQTPEGWTLHAPGAQRIDPTYVFSSFSGSVSDNFGYTATYDLQGRTWLGGVAFGAQYPTSNGVQANFGGGGVDIALMLFNPTGTGVVSATYLGGSAQEQPHSLRVAPNGDLVVMGVSNSLNFPTTGTAYDTSLAHQPAGGSLGGGGVVFQSPTDVVLVRLNPTGSALQASTYYGRFGYDGLQDVSTPHYGDEARGDVWVDSDGIWIATASRSRGLATWPLDTSRGGTTDGLLAHFSPDLDTLRWATYVGGPGLDGLTSLIPTPSPSGTRLAVLGWTSGMGNLSGSGITTVPNGQAEAYYALFDPSNGQMLGQTYLEPQYCTSYGFLAAQNPAGAYAAVGD